jgi:hypothetical protein
MGAQASAPEAPPLSRSQALASRQLRVKGADGADDFGSISPLQLLRAQGLLPPLGDWWSTPAAHALCTALEEALESMPSPARSHALDALGFQLLPGVATSGHCRVRRALGGDAPEDGEFDPLWHAPEEWSEDDPSCEPSAVVLQDEYPNDATDKDSFRITLRTVVFGALVHCPIDEYKRAGFGRLPIAIQPSGKQPSFDASPCTAIAIDGEWLTSVAVAVLPAEKRERIKSAQISQLVRALRDCLAQRWAGGLTMLRKRVAPLLSVDAQIALDALATHIVLARTGGEPTLQSRHLRAHQAELLKGQGKTAEADALERANAQDARAFSALDGSSSKKRDGDDDDAAPKASTADSRLCMCGPLMPLL